MNDDFREVSWVNYMGNKDTPCLLSTSHMLILPQGRCTLAPTSSFGSAGSTVKDRHWLCFSILDILHMQNQFFDHPGHC